MPVHLQAPQVSDLHAVAGLRIGVTEAGVRKADRKDLTVVLIDEGASVSGVFTQNRFCAAPVQICREHLASGSAIRAMVINTGNANAGTGEEGLRRAKETCAALAAQLHIDANQVLPFSTGVIMEQLPSERIIAGLPKAIAAAGQAPSAQQWVDAANGIMTTDTVPKAASAQANIHGVTVNITGISKGAGMIRPNMATMLGFLATDACVAPELLKPLALALAEGSFNRVTVDGDTSTNDTLLLFATGASGAPRIARPGDARLADFREKLEAVLLDLAMQLVRDGEGATKFVKIVVSGAQSQASARKIARTIAESPLVKTALAGEDANWGRIVMAVGRADEPVNRDRLSIRFGPLQAALEGAIAPTYDEAAMSAYMKNAELEIGVDVGVGRGEAAMWTCDLTKRYVEINGDYRS